MNSVRQVIRGRLRRHSRYVVWGVLGALGTALLALIAALVWVERPAPGPGELLGPPHVSAWQPGPCGDSAVLTA